MVSGHNMWLFISHLLKSSPIIGSVFACMGTMKLYFVQNIAISGFVQVSDKTTACSKELGATKKYVAL